MNKLQFGRSRDPFSVVIIIRNINTETISEIKAAKENNISPNALKDTI
jgi:hypothetical protein